MASFSTTLAIVLFHCFLFGYGFSDNVEVKSERDLRRDLFDYYDKLVRPVKTYSKGIVVTVALNPLAIRDLDENSHVLTLESWLFLEWTDDYLQWDPSDYDGIDVLRIPPTEVWKPDISLYTGLTDEPLKPTADMLVLVNSNGSVWWVPPFAVRSRCIIPFSKVPKNGVQCNIRFGSWVYGSDYVDFKLLSETVDLSNFVDNNIHWKLDNIVAGREDKYYPCCPENYPIIDYNITLSRRWQNKNADSLFNQVDRFI